MVDRKKPERYKAADATHKLGVERFKLASDAYHKQSQRELDDLEFAARRGQWRDDEIDARKGFTAGKITITPRPMLVIDKLRQPIQQLENQQRSANLAVDVHPEGKDANQQTAEAIQGIYRHIQVTSRADQIARFWAYSRGIKCGRGYYSIEKVYCDPHPEPDDPARFDMDLRISRILNQAGVLLDPFAQEPDWSDGEWAFIKSWIPRRKYQRDHPDSDLSADDCDFSVVGAGAPGWLKATGNKETDAVLEVLYWRVEYDDEQTVEAGEKSDDPESPSEDYQERSFRKRHVYCCKLNAKESYDEIENDIDEIPIVVFIANEENLDGERIWEGLVAPAKDPQRLYNGQVSALFETIATAPKAPYTATIEQIGPYKAMWDQLNVRNFPYLPYVARSEAGNLLPPPQRVFGEPPIQAIVAGIHQADADVNATTGFFDPSRGNLSSGERSGVALQALQKQTETGNSGYLDNLAQISMMREAKIVLKWIPKVYDRPGRLVTLLGLDNKRDQVVLGQPFVKGPQGAPQPLEMGPDGQPIVPQGVAPADVQTIDLAKGAYSSVVTIGKGQANAAAEANEAMGALFQAEPQLFMMMGDLYLKNQDWPGAQEMAERMKKMLPPQLQDQGGQPNAQQLQQQLTQMQAQMQQLQPLADANQAKLQQAQIDQQTALQQAQIDAASKEKIAAAQEETKRQLAMIDAETERQKAQAAGIATTNAAAAKSQADLQKTAIQEQSDLQQQRNEHEFKAVSQIVEHGHAAQMADHEVANRPEPAAGV